MNSLTDCFSQIHLVDTAPATQAMGAVPLASSATHLASTTAVAGRQVCHNPSAQSGPLSASASNPLPRVITDLIYSYAYEYILREVDGQIARLPADIEEFIRNHGRTFTRLDMSFTHQTSGSLASLARYCTGLVTLDLSNSTFNIRVCRDPAACRRAAGSNDAFRENRGGVGNTHSGISLANAMSYFTANPTLQIRGATRITSSCVSDTNRAVATDAEMHQLEVRQHELRRAQSSDSERELMQLDAEFRELQFFERRREERKRDLDEFSEYMRTII